MITREVVASALRFERKRLRSALSRLRAHQRRHNGDRSLLKAARSRLARVEKALQRLAAGTYGICERCGSQIPMGRLEAIIDASLCLRCAEEQARVAGSRGTTGS